MHFLEVTLSDLYENLALDEALLLAAEAGGPEVLRLWEWPAAAVVLGAGGRLEDDVDVAACAADDVPIARRSSGGGTVLLGAGCLLYSLILRFDRAEILADLRASNRFILGTIRQCLAPAGGIDLQGVSDLVIGGSKFSGNAQQRKRTHLLHHGTLLYRFDIEAMARYLKSPPRQPEYRQGRSHADFVTNLPVERATIVQALKDAWQAQDSPRDWPRDAARALARERYETREWIFRR